MVASKKGSPKKAKTPVKAEAAANAEPEAPKVEAPKAETPKAAAKGRGRPKGSKKAGKKAGAKKAVKRAGKKK